MRVFSFLPTVVGMIAILIVASVTAGYGQDGEVNTVVVEGRSAAEDLGRAFDEAKEDAFREAVHQAAGLIVGSDTLTKNYNLVADKVFTKSRGYIKDFEILSKGRDDDGFYVVKISADVVVGQLTVDLQSLGLLREVTGHQRIMVFGVEKVDGAVKDTEYVRQQIEEALLQKGFDVVDMDQAERIKARDVALNLEDYSTAASLGKRYDAEMIVTYKAEATHIGRENLMGVMFERYDAILTAKLIKVDTGRLRSSLTAESNHGSESRGKASSKALQKAGDDLSKKVVVGVIEALKREFDDEGADLELYVKNMDFRAYTTVKKKLGGIRFVKSVGSAKFNDGIGIYRLKATMQAEAFAEKLMDIEGLEELEITGVEQNRVDATWGGGDDF
ncbi:hypothetical protein JXA32_08765 [Candidatus Sumerlaeota bacterium]|nr:hypothetical protein [Candidatus Sumerlaeota bacterium]